MARDIYEFKDRIWQADATKFTQFVAGTTTLTFGAAGVIVNLPATTTASEDGSYDSLATHNFTDSCMLVEITEIPALTATNTYAGIYVRQSGANQVYWEITQGVMRAYQDVASVQTQRGSNITFDINLHRWIRIREGLFAGGTIGTTYWDYSADGQTWTNHTSIATPITVTACFTVINCYCLGVDTSPGRFSARNLNLPNTPNVRVPQLRPAPFMPGMAR